MIGACPVPGTGGGFLSATLLFIDCATQALAGEGYRALSSGTSTATILGLLLTLFVAGQGLRLLGGQWLGSRDLLLIALKVGAVLTLAGSWDAYRVLVHDVVLHAPAEIVSDLAQGAGFAGGSLITRLQSVDNGLLTLTRLGSGYLDVGSVQAADQAPAVVRTPVSDSMALAGARILYLVVTLAVFGLLRLVSGILLALGPVFAGLLLFDATRGLFLGWARLLFGSLLAAVAVTLVLEVELALLMPWLNDVLTQRLARVATPAAPVELLVLVTAFAAILPAALLVSWRLALAAGLVPTFARVEAGGPTRHEAPIFSAAPATVLASARGASASPSEQIQAGTVLIAERTVGSMRSLAALSDGGRIPEPRTETSAAPVPLGQTYRRQTRALSGGRRERGRS